jgi:NAD+ kinase
MQRVAIASRKNLEKHVKTFERVVKYLEQKGKEVFLEDRVAELMKLKKYKEFIPGKTSVDLVIVMGGDGTILRVISRMKDLKAKFFGINMGHLGFLSEIPPVNIRKTLDNVFAGRHTIDARMMLTATLERNEKVIKTFKALNEVAIAQGTLCRLISLKTKVDRMKLATFKADGLLVSTPTGSTAYNLSAGGPIVHPSLHAFILTPINPHSFNQKPIVLPDDKKIEVKIISDYKAINFTIDGQQNVKVRSGDRIKIQKDGVVEFIRLPNEHYFMNLRHKLGWGERVEKLY